MNGRIFAYFEGEYVRLAGAIQQWRAAGRQDEHILVRLERQLTLVRHEIEAWQRDLCPAR